MTVITAQILEYENTEVNVEANLNGRQNGFANDTFKFIHEWLDGTQKHWTPDEEDQTKDGDLTLNGALFVTNLTDTYVPYNSDSLGLVDSPAYYDGTGLAMYDDDLAITSKFRKDGFSVTSALDGTYTIGIGIVDSNTTYLSTNAGLQISAGGDILISSSSGSVTVEALNIASNVLSSTETNADIVIEPNGAGALDVNADLYCYNIQADSFITNSGFDSSTSSIVLVDDAGTIKERNIDSNVWSINQDLSTTGTPTFAQLTVDNIRLDGNTLSSISGAIEFNASAGDNNINFRQSAVNIYDSDLTVEYDIYALNGTFSNQLTVGQLSMLGGTISGTSSISMIPAGGFFVLTGTIDARSTTVGHCFATTGWGDPAAGVAYDAKFGGSGNGIAVRGASLFLSPVTVAQLNVDSIVINNSTISSTGDITLDPDGGDVIVDGKLTSISLNVSGLTPSRLCATDGSKNIASVSDLTSWIAGTTNRVTVTSDGDGSVTLSTPQDFHTGATPTFTGLKLSGLTDTYLPYYTSANGFANSGYSYSSSTKVLTVEKAGAIGLENDIGKFGPNLLYLSDSDSENAVHALQLSCDWENEIAEIKAVGAYTDLKISSDADILLQPTGTIVVDPGSMDDDPAHLLSTGSFTATFTGFTTTQQHTIYWSRCGNAVTMRMPTFTGTSNASSFTIDYTTIPSELLPNSDQIIFICGLVTNHHTAAAGHIRVRGASNWSIYRAIPDTPTYGDEIYEVSWDTSGNKGFGYKATFTYLLN